MMTTWRRRTFFPTRLTSSLRSLLYPDTGVINDHTRNFKDSSFGFDTLEILYLQQNHGLIIDLCTYRCRPFVPCTKRSFAKWVISSQTCLQDNALSHLHFYTTKVCMRAPPPSPIVFIFMQFLATFGQIIDWLGCPAPKFLIRHC